jgi:hypothetical protein
MLLASALSDASQAWKDTFLSKVEKAIEHRLPFDGDTRALADAIEELLCQLWVREHAVSGRVELQVQFSKRDV